MGETAALITALGTFLVVVLGAIGTLAKLVLSEVRSIRAQQRETAVDTKQALDAARETQTTLSPNHGPNLHDAIRRIETKVDGFDHTREREHAELWAAIHNRIRRPRFLRGKA